MVLKSFDQANRAITEINRLVLLLGVAALFLGTLLMIALSRAVTRPLEALAQGVRAFGIGDQVHELPQTGTREVRELSAAFARMRSEILDTNRALLDAERLATIGSMASSVSRDLRHYLAAVYANAEFLSSSRLSQKERDEFLTDIQIAVHGATELLESLLNFSRTGAAFHRKHESLARIAERSIALLKPHPEAEGVSVRMECDDPSAAEAFLDAKQMQRAVYNLLLNGCQSARKSEIAREVKISISTVGDRIFLNVTDSGPGVPEHIRESLFEPFVSDGKQSGTGLGLTLANAIAKEHGGFVTLLSTRPGETIFQLALRTDSSGREGKAASGRQGVSPPYTRRRTPMIHPTRYSVATLFIFAAGLAAAQTSPASQTSSVDEVRRQVELLAEAVARDETELKSSREEINTLRGQVQALQGQLAGTEKASATNPQQQVGEQAALRLNNEMERLREEQDLQQGEIATQAQAKVESESKFPVKLTGLILVNGSVNTSGVNSVQAPTVATAGPRTTGLTLSQTVLGLDARGPNCLALHRRQMCEWISSEESVKGAIPKCRYCPVAHRPCGIGLGPDASFYSA